MTASFTRAIRQAGLVLAFATSFSALASTASFAFSAEAQQMCTGDAFRLCSSEIPNIPKIAACARDVSRFCRAHMNDGDQIVLACLKQNRSRLSKACQQVLASHGQ